MIENAVREVKGKEKTEEYVNSLRSQAKIEVDESRLKQIASAPPADQHQGRVQPGAEERQAFPGRFRCKLLHALPPDSPHPEGDRKRVHGERHRSSF